MSLVKAARWALLCLMLAVPLAIADNPYQHFPAVLTDYLWDTGWVESTRSTAEYDNQDRIIGILNENYVSGQWDTTSRVELEYTTGDGPDTLTIYMNPASWTPVQRSVFTYDAQGNINTEQIEMYYLNDWLIQSRTTNTYNGSGRPTESIREVYLGGAWDNQSRTTFDYTDSLLSEQTQYLWSGIDWMQAQRTVHSYTNDLETERVNQFWGGTAWEDSERFTSTYNGDQKATEIGQSWNGTGWDNIQQELYESYDAQGRLESSISQLWNGSAWGNLSRTVYTWDMSTSVGDDIHSHLPNGISLSQNYPNPFNPATAISFSLPSRSDVSVEIFDILGRQVSRIYSGSVAAGDHTLEWNGTDRAGNPVASGMYFYRLQTDAGTLSRKMMLVK